jgi:ketosteroid isomerase-like protein
MTSRTLKILAAALFASMAAPLPAELPSVSSTDRQQLEQLNARWFKSYETRDQDALGRILAEGFIGMYGDTALSRSDMLSALKRRNILKASWENLRINVSGDTAVVTAVSTIVSERAQTRSTSRYRYADVYTRKDDGWRAIASHVVRVE